ncbi:MAG: hypothetical protein E6G60_15000 [Actinobacteria bacterium]|nr:MAG: hypothetical protein E6G60_15000 [Actinomycetota bacterium]
MAGAGRSQGFEPDCHGSAADARDRHDRANPAGAASPVGRLQNEGPRPAVHAPPRRGEHRLRRPERLHARLEHADRPEHGVVLPGALGAVSLVVALYGLSVLPPNWGGVALLALGAALLVVDIHVATHGVLTVAGLVSFVVGSLLLFRNEPAPYHVSTVLVGSIAGTLALFWSFALSRVIAARRTPPMTGPGQLVGEIGEVRDGGLVLVRGELWQAKTHDGELLRPGQRVEVEAVEQGGLILDVRALADPAGHA